MTVITITSSELLERMLRYTTAMPCDVAHNLALAELLSERGIRMASRSLFGQTPPTLAPPYTRSWNPARLEWTIEQDD